MSTPWTRFLPFLDLRGARGSDVGKDVVAALAVTVLSVPQGVAYAMIAGLPPAMGLYAASIPAVVGALFRSSRLVITGPSNALSLLVGGAVATMATRGVPAVEVAVTLALLVGVFQLAAGLARLGLLVDYISSPVVVGYVTGAAVLIAAGQLGNLTNTPLGKGNLVEQLAGWLPGVTHTHLPTLLIGLGSAALVLGLRALDARIPGPVVVMLAGGLVTWVFDLGRLGVRVVGDVSPILAAGPPLTLPDLHLVVVLAPLALSATVLSLVEGTSVARALAARVGEKLEPDSEFTGQGLANLVAAFVGAYPTSGSLARSLVAWRSGARTRLVGVAAGLLTLAVALYAGPLVNRTPIASFAGLLLVLAGDVVDRSRVRLILRSGRGDVAAFLATMVGAWLLDLDRAISLGVLISIVLFLRRARLLTVRELGVDADGRLREAVSPLAPDDDDDAPALAEGFRACADVRVLHVEGSLFFGAATELGEALGDALRDPRTRVLVVRVKRCHGLDVTAAEVLRAAAEGARREGRHLVLVGMRPPVMERMHALGLVEALGADHVFPTEPAWFAAMDHAIARSLDWLHPHTDAEECPLRLYLHRRATNPESP